MVTISKNSQDSVAAPAPITPAVSDHKSGWRWTAAIFLLLTVVQQEFEVMPWPPFAALLAISCLFALGRAYAGMRTRERAILLICVTASLLVVAAPAAFNPALLDPYQFVRRVAGPLAAWITVLLLLQPDRAADPAQHAKVRSTKLSIAALLVATFGSLAVAHLLAEGRYIAIIDETLYLLQSRLLREGHFVRPIDQAFAPFFALRQSAIEAGRFYTEYPPGWPWLLALFDAIGLRWWSCVVISTIGVWLTYLLGSEIYSPRIGIGAALLLATNVIFVVYGASYFAHIPAMTLCLAAAWLLIRAERAGRQVLYWFAAGFLLAGGCAIRPLTGVALGLSLLLWVILRGRYPLRKLPRLLFALAAGSLLPIAGVLRYNLMITGHPFVFGYQAANGTLHNLGFGERGWLAPDAFGRVVPSTIHFTPFSALTNLVERFYDLNTIALPAAILGPFAFLAWKYQFRFRWVTVLAFLMLPAAYFFYWYSSIRFYAELLPYLYIGLAAGIAHIGERNRSLAHVLVFCVAASQLIVTGANVHRNWSGRQRVHFPAFEHVEGARQRYRRVLVFVSAHSDKQGLLESLAWFNIDGFNGNVIVARDLGPDNQRLMQRFPDHVPVRVFRSGSGVDLRLLKVSD